jgi:hypothetical protein
MNKMKHQFLATIHFTAYKEPDEVLFELEIQRVIAEKLLSHSRVHNC